MLLYIAWFGLCHALEKQPGTLLARMSLLPLWQLLARSFDARAERSQLAQAGGMAAWLAQLIPLLLQKQILPASACAHPAEWHAIHTDV